MKLVPQLRLGGSILGSGSLHFTLHGLESGIDGSPAILTTCFRVHALQHLLPAFGDFGGLRDGAIGLEVFQTAALVLHGLLPWDLSCLGLLVCLFDGQGWRRGLGGAGFGIYSGCADGFLLGLGLAGCGGLLVDVLPKFIELSHRLLKALPFGGHHLLAETELAQLLADACFLVRTESLGLGDEGLVVGLEGGFLLQQFGFESFDPGALLLHQVGPLGLHGVGVEFGKAFGGVVVRGSGFQGEDTGGNLILAADLDVTFLGPLEDFGVLGVLILTPDAKPHLFQLSLRGELVIRVPPLDLYLCSLPLESLSLIIQQALGGFPLHLRLRGK